MNAVEIIRSLIVGFLPIIFAITFHEVAHGLVALRLGDHTAQSLGRLSLNPIKHVDPVGTVLMPLLLYAMSGGQFVFGYAKPVPINPGNFKDPRKGMAISAAAGPITNIILALISVFIFKGLSLIEQSVPVFVAEPVAHMLRASIGVNVFLAALNLLPVPPLDGGRVLAGLLPRDLANKYDQIEPYGMFIVILLLVTNVADMFIRPIVSLIYGFLSMFM